MDDLPSGDLVIRGRWPLPDWGGRQLRYGLPLMMVCGAALIFATTRWVSTGMPVGLQELNGIFAASGALVMATLAARFYDGTTIAANRERVVINRWLRTATSVPAADLASLKLSTRRARSRRGRNIDQHYVSFITRDGQCAMTLNWGPFTDYDLDQLAKVTGVRQDGGWFYTRAA
jgi:hypothetical protein